MRRLKTIILASLSLGFAFPASAQAPAALGMTVRDTAGGEVGTVTKVEPGFVVVKTDKHEVRLPATSFTPHQGALLFGMTRDQLNAETEKALAAAAAKIAPGAAVSDSAGVAVGTLSAVDADFVTVKLSSGAEVRVPRAGVAPGASGVVVGTTLAQLEAAAKSAPPAPAPQGK
jgi:preprotein translocase subunit YajC